MQGPLPRRNWHRPASHFQVHHAARTGIVHSRATSGSHRARVIVGAPRPPTRHSRQITVSFIQGDSTDNPRSYVVIVSAAITICLRRRARLVGGKTGAGGGTGSAGLSAARFASLLSRETHAAQLPRLYMETGRWASGWRGVPEGLLLASARHVVMPTASLRKRQPQTSHK